MAFGVAAVLALIACGSPSSSTSPTPPSVPDETDTPIVPSRALPGDTCELLSAIPLGEAQPLLRGRLTIRPLAGAREIPVPFNVMDAPAAIEDQSRLYYTAHDDALALSLVADELYQRDVPTFDATARRSLVENGNLPTVIALSTPNIVNAHAIAGMPALLDRRSTTDLLVAYIALPDSTVVRIRMQTHTAGIQNIGRCTSLARRLFDTLALGTRALNVAAGARAFEVFGRRYEVQLPADWSVVVQPGPDFARVYIRQMVAFGEAPPRLVVSFDSRAPEPEVDTHPGTTLVAPFMGQDARWTEYSGDGHDPNHPVLVATTRVQNGRETILASAMTFVPSARDAMVRIAGSIRAAR